MDISLENKQIVLIEDSKTFQRVIGNLLVDNKCVVYVAETAEEGLELIKKEVPDCILTDNNLPGMNGDELCKIVKSDDKLQHIPIVMLTSSEKSEDLIKAVAAGADDYLFKSSNLEVILIKLKSMLRLKFLYDEVIALKQSDAIKSLIVTLSHEFNNTLTIIKGNLKIIKKKENSDPNQNRYIHLEKSLDRLADLIKKVQDLDTVTIEEYIDGKDKMVKLD